jgi:hypothetical protein
MAWSWQHAKDVTSPHPLQEQRFSQASRLDKPRT